jgi:hypothetical protein
MKTSERIAVWALTVAAALLTYGCSGSTDTGLFQGQGGGGGGPFGSALNGGNNNQGTATDGGVSSEAGFGLGLSSSGGSSTSSGGSSTSSGGSSSGGSGGGSAACNLKPGATACSTCIGNNCCAEAQACVGNAGCSDLLRCVDECGNDDACRNECASESPAALPMFKTFITCGTNHCASTCS